MAEWIVTYASMPIEADSAEEAISREGGGGGHWNAYPVRRDLEDALEVHADVEPGDADLAVIHGAVGGLRLAIYQHRDEKDNPLPVVVLDLDRDDPALEVRVVLDDQRLATIPSAPQ